MDTRFVFPVAVAAAIHAGALFGVKWSKHAAPTKPVPTIVLPQDVIRVEDPNPSVIDLADAAAAQGTPDSAPRAEDIVRPDPSEFPQRVAPSMPPVTAPMASIPLGPIGLRDGDPNASLPVGPGIFKVSDLDGLPRTRSQVAPVYPADAKSDGRSAEVVVEFVVDESGRVLNPQVIRSSDRRFEAATLKAVAKWRFEPGRSNGRTVRFRMQAPVIFSLEM